MITVKEVESKRCREYVMTKHYARRWVNARKAFGLFLENSEMVGCVLYSQPASYTLCRGVCGPEFKAQVMELSRLIIVDDAPQNACSMLIGRSKAMLGDQVLVSYADCNEHVGHVGYVYQATNWIYTGHATAEPRWDHPETGEVISYTRRHIDTKAEALGLHWKDLIKTPQVGKHRYVSFSGNRRFRKHAERNLRYERFDYPKGKTHRHKQTEVEKWGLIG